MRMYDIIAKKKKGEELTTDELSFFVDGVTNNTIPDYQTTALLMAICLNGMTDSETIGLTFAMAKSGSEIDLSCFKELSADKHSTGGVGDKTSLIVGPIVAAAGLKVAKMSGRGLGFTGGTIDKLESIRGYNINLSNEEFLRKVEEIGISIVGQSGNLTPADKIIYALRDATATVDSIPLIASSVMSKKLAAGAKTIVLDVKTGSGSFMKDEEEAVILAETMVRIGNSCGKNTAALITNMNSPLGNAIGNSLEVIEVVEVLKEHKNCDLLELSLCLSAIMLSLGLNISVEESRALAEEMLFSNKAFDKFKEWINAQGGDVELIENTELFPKAQYSFDITAQTDGYIGEMNCEEIGVTASILGAGRTTKEDNIDYSSGIVVHRKTGDKVQVGDVIATLYTNDKDALKTAKEKFNNAVLISCCPPSKTPLIIKTII